MKIKQSESGKQEKKKKSNKKAYPNLSNMQDDVTTAPVAADNRNE